MFQGGRHIDYVVDQIVTKLIEVVKKKNKAGVSVKPFQVTTQAEKIFSYCSAPGCYLKPPFIYISGEESHLGFCEFTDREPNL